MILPVIASAIEAAKSEGHMRPVRFAEKELRKIGYILTPEEESMLDDLSVNGGRRPRRDANGNNPDHVVLAGGFELFWKLVREGVRDGDAHARVCKELNIREAALDAVLAKRRSPVNRILRARGSIGKSTP